MEYRGYEPTYKSPLDPPSTDKSDEDLPHKPLQSPVSLSSSMFLPLGSPVFRAKYPEIIPIYPQSRTNEVTYCCLREGGSFSSPYIPSRKLTWKPKKGSIKTIVLSKGGYMGFHVSLGECTPIKILKFTPTLPLRHHGGEGRRRRKGDAERHHGQA